MNSQPYATMAICQCTFQSCFTCSGNSQTNQLQNVKISSYLYFLFKAHDPNSKLKSRLMDVSSLNVWGSTLSQQWMKSFKFFFRFEHLSVLEIVFEFEVFLVYFSSSCSRAHFVITREKKLCFFPCFPAKNCNVTSTEFKKSIRRMAELEVNRIVNFYVF